MTPHTPLPRFVAIDFETADYGRDSACAVSMVVVEQGAVARTVTHLIRPPRRNFVFEYIHGITWADVHDKPTFGELWPEIAPVFAGAAFVAAHNASFDKSVLNACCTAIGHALPEPGFLCTVKLARRAWGLHPTTLPDVCGHLQIPLKHHDATSDANACAHIVLAALREGFDALSLVSVPKPKRQPAWRGPRASMST